MILFPSLIYNYKLGEKKNELRCKLDVGEFEVTQKKMSVSHSLKLVSASEKLSRVLVNNVVGKSIVHRNTIADITMSVPRSCLVSL